MAWPGESVTPLAQLRDRLSEAPDDEAFYQLLLAWFRQQGCGAFGVYRAFRVRWVRHRLTLLPVMEPDPVRLSDLIGYVAIGARSVENQQHRLTASGLNVPVGMKNPTSGDITVMMNSIKAAHHKHIFCYRGWEVETQGNPYAHAILRGYVDKLGRAHSNYHYEDLAHLFEVYKESGLENPAAILDTHHANSGKKYLEQIRISKEILYSCRHSTDVQKLVKGLMIESYIEDGTQKICENSVYGKSVTDPCLGWEKTEKLIYEIADML